MPDEQRVKMAMALVESGHEDRLLEAGMSEETLNRILVENPRRFLSFVPPGVNSALPGR